MAIKLYENASDKTVYLRELDVELKPHDRVSVSSDFPTPFNPVNYPGVADVTDLPADEHKDALDNAKAAFYRGTKGPERGF